MEDFILVSPAIHDFLAKHGCCEKREIKNKELINQIAKKIIEDANKVLAAVK